jgi:hypothetical protein
MAAFLDMQDQVMRRRVENAMQQWERLAEIQIQQFHQRLDAVLFQSQQRVTEIEWRSEGLPLTPVERQDGFYDLLHDMHDDRIEYQEANVIAQVDRQMDRLQQREAEQGPHQGHEQGMGLS